MLFSSASFSTASAPVAVAPAAAFSAAAAAAFSAAVVDPPFKLILSLLKSRSSCVFNFLLHSSNFAIFFSHSLVSLLHKHSLRVFTKSLYFIIL